MGKRHSGVLKNKKGSDISNAWYPVFYVSIAKPYNNAIRMVCQNAKGKKDIYRRSDARQKYVTQTFTV